MKSTALVNWEVVGQMHFRDSFRGRKWSEIDMAQLEKNIFLPATKLLI